MSDQETNQASTIAAFVADFKSKTGKPLCQAILAAINHPQLYVFGELLSQPSVKALQGTEEGKYLEMMEIFSTGTLQQYKDKGVWLQHPAAHASADVHVLPPCHHRHDHTHNQPPPSPFCTPTPRLVTTGAGGKLPTLLPPQLTKLRHLTIVTMSATSKVRRCCTAKPAASCPTNSSLTPSSRSPLDARCCTPLSSLPHPTNPTARRTTQCLKYADLLTELGFSQGDSSIRELEDCLIDAIYGGVLKGKLNQKDRLLMVHETIGRDLRAGQLDELLSTLVQWNTQTKDVLSSLDSKIASVHSVIESEAAQNQSLTDAMEEQKKATKATMDSQGGGADGGAMFDDDYDEPGAGGFGRMGGNKGRKMKHGSSEGQGRWPARRS